jgi:hypothetical protein
VLACDRNTPDLSSFSRGRMVHFMKNSPTQLNWKSSCISRRFLCMWEAEVHAHVFPMRTELPYNRNTTYLSLFSRGKHIYFMKTALFRRIGEKLLCSWRIPSMLEAGVSSSCFLCENWVSMWQAYFLYGKFISGRSIHCMENSRINLNWRILCIS